MSEKRIIKRYTNRKLYDKQESRYVTLEEIARLVRRGEDLKVVDNETDDDLTAVTLAQIILEEEKRKTHLLSVPFLRKLIRSGEATVSPNEPGSGSAKSSAGPDAHWREAAPSSTSCSSFPSAVFPDYEKPPGRRSTSCARTRRFAASSSASRTASRRSKKRSRA
jgi:polyhydroxyalkanoate synthesis repressor PhaR